MCTTSETMAQSMKLFYSLLMLTAACGIAHAAPSSRGFEVAQGVIVDALHAVVYMPDAQGGIDAVDLSSGEVIVSSPRGAKPLLLYEDLLLASARDRTDALSIVGLTAKDLQSKFKVTLPLPDQVGTGPFYVGAHISGSEIIVHWRSIRRPISPIPTREPAVVTTGFARIDPTMGRLIATAEGEPPALPPPPTGDPSRRPKARR